MSSEADEESIDLFQEPADFYEPEKEATFATHTLLNGKELTVRLVGHNPLWGHHLWNAGRTTSTFFELHPSLLSSKSVLELGAGAGLPSLVAALLGARRVVVTDYPDSDLIVNLSHNISSASLPSSVIVAEGYLWGAPTSNLTKYLDEGEQGFDVLILADLLFNHSEHAKLIQTVQQTLKKSGEARAYVFFSPYRPWLLEKDLAFFEEAGKAGFRVEKTFEKVMEKVMFEEDPGDELLRRTVFGYELSWAE